MTEYSMILIIVILLILAIYWEYKDYMRIAKRNCIDTIPDDKRERELKFYATFMTKNNIVWRFNFILCFICFCAMMYVLKSLNITTNINKNVGMMLFFMTFLIFHLGFQFKTYHFYRVMTSKIETDTIIL
jgi:hypothetical protein